MTYQEMFDRFDTLVDKFGGPYFPDESKDQFLNDAQKEWFDNNYPIFETDERRREQFNPLVRTTTIPGPIGEFTDADLTDKFRIIGVGGEWDFVCNGVTTRRTIAIPPLKHDSYYRSLTDPDEAPTDAFPGYLQTNDGTQGIYQVKSTNAPQSISVSFLIAPPVIDGTNNPATNYLLSDDVADEVILIAARIATGNTENYPKYQMLSNELNQ